MNGRQKGIPGCLLIFSKSSGARSFEESAMEAEEHWNECIKEVLWKGGFGAPSENLGGLGEFSLRVASRTSGGGSFAFEKSKTCV